MESDCKLLEDAKRDWRKRYDVYSGCSGVQIIQGYQSKLAELEKCAEKLSLAFERNKTLDNLITEVKSLGKGSDWEDSHQWKEIIVGPKCPVTQSGVR